MPRYTFGPGTLYLRRSMFPSDGSVQIIIREAAAIYESLALPERFQEVIVDGKRLPYDPRRGWSFFAPPAQWRCLIEPTSWPEICDAGVHGWRYSDAQPSADGGFIGGAVGSTRRCDYCGTVAVRDPDVWPPPGTDEAPDDEADEDDEAPPGG